MVVKPVKRLSSFFLGEEKERQLKQRDNRTSFIAKAGALLPVRKAVRAGNVISGGHKGKSRCNQTHYDTGQKQAPERPSVN